MPNARSESSAEKIDLSGLTACHTCDLLIEKQPALSGSKTVCPRCGSISDDPKADTVNKTLAYNNKIYKFKLEGLGALGYGVQKLSGVGHVYHLKDIADFPGGYSEARAGLTVAKGIGALYIRKDKGVVIEMRTHADGVALSVGVSGITIEME